MGRMPDEPQKKPDPIDDLRAGLGLLFRAAKTAVDELPTSKFEDVVKQGVREVGRAIENVTSVIEEQVTGKKPAKGQAEASSPEGSAPPTDPPAPGGSPPPRAPSAAPRARNAPKEP